MRVIRVYVAPLGRWQDISCPSLSPTVVELGAAISHHLRHVENVSDQDMSSAQLVAGKHVFSIPIQAKTTTQQNKLKQFKVDDLMLGRVLSVTYLKGKKQLDVSVSVTCGGVTRSYSLCRDASLSSLQHMIAHDTHLYVKKQRLYWNGKDLSQGTAVTLAEAGIQDGDNIVVMPKLLGGSGRSLNQQVQSGTPFVDLSDENGLRRITFNPSPPWRVCAPGLNLEGTCINPACQARGNRVIMQMPLQGYELVEGESKREVKSAAGTTIRTPSPRVTPGLFDLMEDVDAQSCQCPMCHHFVEPITCGFHHCYWRYAGKMRATVGSPSRAVESVGWKKAPKDAYMLFDPNDKTLGGSGIVTWFRLQIEIMSSDSDPDSLDECSICLESLHEISVVVKYGTRTHTSCGHTFHAQCLNGWKTHTPTCPQCRATLS